MVEFYDIKQTRRLKSLISAAKFAPRLNITAKIKHLGLSPYKYQTVQRSANASDLVTKMLK
jgi:hypothetical protein